MQVRRRARSPLYHTAQAMHDTLRKVSKQHFGPGCPGAYQLTDFILLTGLPKFPSLRLPNPKSLGIKKRRTIDETGTTTVVEMRSWTTANTTTGRNGETTEELLNGGIRGNVDFETTRPTGKIRRRKMSVALGG